MPVVARRGGRHVVRWPFFALVSTYGGPAWVVWFCTALRCFGLRFSRRYTHTRSRSFPAGRSARLSRVHRAQHASRGVGAIRVARDFRFRWSSEERGRLPLVEIASTPSRGPGSSRTGRTLGSQCQFHRVLRGRCAESPALMTALLRQQAKRGAGGAQLSIPSRIADECSRNKINSRVRRQNARTNNSAADRELGRAGPSAWYRCCVLPRDIRPSVIVPFPPTP